MNSKSKNDLSSKPQARIEVQELNSYNAPLEGRRKKLRLDFNENTIGPSPLVVNALREISADQIAIYPEYAGIREEIVKNLSNNKLSYPLKVSQVEIFNGVDAAIHAIFTAFGEKNSLFLTTEPTFGYYFPCAEMQGMEILKIPYEEEDFAFPFKRIKTLVKEKKPKIVFICNPNNPTGTRLSPDKILEIAECSPKTLVVVDELYEAFTGDSVLPKVDFSNHKNIILLRSLSKTAGLAGLRFGFALGNQKILENIKSVTGPYDINSFAITAAIAALKDQKYIDSYVNEVLKAKEWINNKLKVNNINYHSAGGNYMLIWPNNNFLEVEKNLKKIGILVRSMKNKPLIDKSLRVSIGTTKQMKDFWESYKKIENINSLN